MQYTYNDIFYLVIRYYKIYAMSHPKLELDLPGSEEILQFFNAFFSD